MGKHHNVLNSSNIKCSWIIPHPCLLRDEAQRLVQCQSILNVFRWAPAARSWPLLQSTVHTFASPAVPCGMVGDTCRSARHCKTDQAQLLNVDVLTECCSKPIIRRGKKKGSCMPPCAHCQCFLLCYVPCLCAVICKPARDIFPWFVCLFSCARLWLKQPRSIDRHSFHQAKASLIRTGDDDCCCLHDFRQLCGVALCLKLQS